MARRPLLLPAISLLAAFAPGAGTRAAERQVKVLRRARDPYGFPRPERFQSHVPLETSVYLELGVAGEGAKDDAVDADSVHVWIQRLGGERISLLEPGRRFVPGCSGRLFPRTDSHGTRSLVVSIDPHSSLQPESGYAIGVSARSSEGAGMGPLDGIWGFTTEAPPGVRPLALALDVRETPVAWRGGFFTGFCKASFCTSRGNMIPTYELMERVRQRSPRAWSLQRDFWMTGMLHRPRFLSGNLPNIVRERETRRIASIEEQPGKVSLRVEDVFGHGQYGIPTGRPPSADYRTGDAVLVADGVSDARTTVLEVDDPTRTVVVRPFDTPRGGWLLAYEGPLPDREDPNAPGLFPPGGCYLRKLDPPGTPQYFWGRLDEEFDLAHRRFGRRLIPNFCDAPGDLAIDGRNWTRPKDYAEYHDVVRAIAGHLIERYGEACLDFLWSVFNEPDLGVLFWRSDWEELQRFYDYTVDGILRAFEDHGLDADRVAVGGLELGAIFGTNLRLEEFLEHCSPHVAGAKALRLNAAFADARLEGRRSRRVETLCRTHGGMGSPCDFVSIHAYNRSAVMAAKLIRAKEIALGIDPEFYATLRVDSHESCPAWSPPPDPAAMDSYLGNGYFPTWCADVARRLIAKAASDRRYAFGESILTFWQWQNTNFEGANAATRMIHVDDDGDGRGDRTVTVAMPILHFLGLLAGMGERFWPLEEHIAGGHIVSGFAARSDRALTILVYAHHALDTESRSGRAFDVRLSVTGLAAGPAAVTEYRFDKAHNSYFELGRRLREESMDAESTLSPEDRRELGEAAKLAGSAERASRLEGLRRLARLGPRAKSAVSIVVSLVHDGGDEEIRREAFGALLSLNAPPAYPADVVREVERLSQLACTRYEIPDAAVFSPTVRLSANAACIVVVEEGGS
ncbi:MAG: hypothetical protein JXP34_27865 [Planctomycetes bacterium]|nr:hypothetical protein [Planctomycetota bacterium]